MQHNNLENQTKEWILVAQHDLEAAEILEREKGPTDALCFHCHQAVEKILKGFLVFSRREFRKIHDLIYLLNLCKEVDRDFNQVKDEISFLNRYYTEFRYPPEPVSYSREECKQSLQYADEIMQFVINKIC